MAGTQALNAVLVFSGDASQAIGTINTLNTNLDKLVSKLGSVSRSGTSVSRQQDPFKVWTESIKSFNNGAQRFVDSFRLMSQGVMSMGRALTFFVSIPVGAVLAFSSQEVLNFNDGLIRVAKTTGLSNDASVAYADSLGYVADELRRIAKRAPTTHTELAKMAEQAGQLGITVPKRIADFVEWMEILATTTDITHDTVVERMGRVAAAFGWNLNQSTDSIVRLSNVINMLENTTASAADEIVSALYRFAPAANMLGIHAADAAALSAALISAGFSAETTGTLLGTMYVQLVRNADKFAELARNVELYSTETAALNAINEDAVSVLFDLIVMMSEEENKAVAVAEAFDILGMRGGRALGGLISNQEGLREALERVRKEWGEAASLVIEYNRALESSQNLMKILKNNVQDVAIGFSNSLLPVLNDLILLFIPLLRRAGAFFESMEQNTKKLIVVIALLSIVGAPLLFFISQMVFGLNMIGLGMIRLTTSIMLGIKNIVQIVFWLGKFASMSWLTAAAVIGAAALILKILSNMGLDVAGFFKDLGARAVAWGENLAANIANGFISGAIRYITTAINWVANLIASFFEGHSPPSAGPLSHIDKWGKTLIDTFFRGMLAADFKILEDVSGAIEKIFSTLAKSGVIGEKDQFKFLLQAREDLAELLSIFRETGEISESVLNQIVARLGNASDEIKDYVRYSVELMAIEQALADIERRRTQINDNFADSVEDIAASGDPAADRVSQIREAMRMRDRGLKGLATEERSLKEQKELAEAQLETQKAMIQAMQKQDDIQLGLLDKLEKLAAGAGAGMALPEIEPGQLDLEDFETQLSEIGKPIIEFEAKISSKSKVWDAFVAGLTGAPLEIPTNLSMAILEDPGRLAQAMGLKPEDLQLYYDMYDLGTRIRTKFEEVRTTIQNISAAVSGIFSGGGGTFTQIGESLSDAFTKAKEAIEPLRPYWEAFVAAILPSLATISDSWEIFKESVAELAPIFGKMWSILATVALPVLKAIGKGLLMLIVTPILALMGIIAGLAKAFARAFKGLVTYMAPIGRNVIAILKGFKHLWQAVKDLWAAFMGRDPQAIVEAFKGIFTSLWEIIKGLFSMMGNVIAGGVSFIINLISGFVSGIWDFFKGLYDRLVGGSLIPDLINGMISIITTGLTTLVTSFLTWITNVISIFTTLFNAMLAVGQAGMKIIGAAIRTGIVFVLTIIRLIGAAIVAIWTGNWTRLREIAITAWNLIKAFANTAMNALRAILNVGLSIIVGLFGTKFSSIYDTVVKWINKAKDWVNTQKTRFKTVATNLINGIVDGIKDGASRVLEAIKEVINNAIKRAKELLGISSPSTEFMTIGINAIKGLVEGFQNLANLESALQGLTQNLINIVLRGLQELQQRTLAMWRAIMAAWRESLAGQVVQIFGGLGITMYEALKASATYAAQGLNPILAKIAKVMEFVRNPPTMPTLEIVTIETTVRRTVKETVSGTSNKKDPTKPTKKKKTEKKKATAIGTGGYVPDALTALIGDAPKGEVVIPLKKFPDVLRNLGILPPDMTGLGSMGKRGDDFHPIVVDISKDSLLKLSGFSNQRGGDVNINIAATIRGEADIKKLALEIKKVLSQETNLSVRYGNAA